LTPIEAYAAPETIEEAAKLAADGTATMFAGGTDLMPQTKSGAKTFSRALLNLRRVEGMRGAIEEKGEIRIGALTTVTDVLNDELLRSVAPVLCETADKFASGQIRNSATIGGNICNASPAADMIIPLLTLDAEVELVSWVDDETNWRLIPLKNFFKGPGQSKLRKNEILKSVKFQTPATDFVAGFVKFGTRPALDISVVSVGIGGRLNAGVLTNARVAFGAVAPIPMRGLETEAVIEGKQIDDTIIKAATAKAAVEVSPIDDVRASAWYRRELIQTLTGRLLRHVVQTGD
jgi:CO/xanthine dehydrogenase FAD-binding subunit